MDGYILLADGTRLDGQLAGARRTAVGWLAANTSVVGFQELATDPAYAGCILALTYPEVGNVGVNAASFESSGVRSATSLSVTDELSGPRELLDELDWAFRLPVPHPDWEF